MSSRQKITRLVFGQRLAVPVLLCAGLGAGAVIAQTAVPEPALPQTDVPPVTGNATRLTNVLADQRPPHTLSDAQLLNRLALLELLIDAKGVAKSIKAVAISMRDFDRAERDRRRIINMRPDKFPIAVLADTKPSTQMSETELRLRLEKIRDQLARPDIPLIARDQLREKQARDAFALQQRLKGVKPVLPVRKAKPAQ